MAHKILMQMHNYAFKRNCSLEWGDEAKKKNQFVCSSNGKKMKKKNEDEKGEEVTEIVILLHFSKTVQPDVLFWRVCTLCKPNVYVPSDKQEGKEWKCRQQRSEWEKNSLREKM